MKSLIASVLLSMAVSLPLDAHRFTLRLIIHDRAEEIFWDSESVAALAQKERAYYLGLIPTLKLGTEHLAHVAFTEARLIFHRLRETFLASRSSQSLSLEISHPIDDEYDIYGKYIYENNDINFTGLTMSLTEIIAKKWAKGDLDISINLYKN